MWALPKSFNRAVFLDRDGTLNEDKGYLYLWKDWQWLPGVIPGLKRLYSANYKLIVVSNQSGIARNYFKEVDINELNTRIIQDLKKYGIQIQGFYHCPHHPQITGGCFCRKPSPGMILQAARDWDINLEASWLIGDKTRDIHAGIAAGCKSILLKTGCDNNKQTDIPPNIPIFKNFLNAADYILKHTKS